MASHILRCWSYLTFAGGRHVDVPDVAVLVPEAAVKVRAVQLPVLFYVLLVYQFPSPGMVILQAAQTNLPLPTLILL